MYLDVRRIRLVINKFIFYGFFSNIDVPYSKYHRVTYRVENSKI